jgi:hypothetical protein
MLLKESVAPNVEKSSTDNEEPIRLIPNRDNVDPKRAKLRRAREEPS